MMALVHLLMRYPVTTQSPPWISAVCLFELMLLRAGGAAAADDDADDDSNNNNDHNYQSLFIVMPLTIVSLRALMLVQ